MTSRVQRDQRVREVTLLAAADLFAELGFAGVTLEKIAARAGLCVGDVGELFPDELTVFQEVVSLALADAQVIFDELLRMAADTSDWEGLIDHAVESFAAASSERRSLRAVFANLQLYGPGPAHARHTAAGDRTLRDFADAIVGLLAVWAPGLTEARRLIVATTLVQTLLGVLLTSKRQPPELAQAMLDEAKIMLRRYLSAWIEQD